METFSASLALCAGNSPVPGEFPAQRPETWNLDVSFDLRLNIRFSKQSWGWWFETPSCPLWRYCNDLMALEVQLSSSSWWWWCSWSYNGPNGISFYVGGDLMCEERLAAYHYASRWGLSNYIALMCRFLILTIWGSVRLITIIIIIIVTVINIFIIIVVILLSKLLLSWSFLSLLLLSLLFKHIRTLSSSTNYLRLERSSILTIWSKCPLATCFFRTELQGFKNKSYGCANYAFSFRVTLHYLFLWSND